jgi:hypothetical protein
LAQILSGQCVGAIFVFIGPSSGPGWIIGDPQGRELCLPGEPRFRRLCGTRARRTELGYAKRRADIGLRVGASPARDIIGVRRYSARSCTLFSAIICDEQHFSFLPLVMGLRFFFCGVRNDRHWTDIMDARYQDVL